MKINKRALGYIYEEYKKAVKKFSEDALKNPRHAIAWYANDVATLQTAKELLENFEDTLDISDNPLEVANKHIDEITDKITSGYYRPCSTGIFFNAVSTAEGEGATKALAVLRSMARYIEEDMAPKGNTNESAS